MSLTSSVLHLLDWLPERVRHGVIRSTFNFSDADIADVRVKMAETANEALAAGRVLHDAYVGRDLTRAHPSGIRTSAHALLPSTHTFIATLGGRVVGTMSLIGDSPLGLPLEAVYGAEVEQMRRDRNTLAEVGALAILPGFRNKGIVCLLNRLMFQVAETIGVDKLVVAVHPAVQEIYRASLLFERFGKETRYPGLSAKARAVGLALDVRTAESRFRQAFAHSPRTNANPHYLYVESARPEVVTPPPGDLRRHGDREAMARALLRARPDVLEGLSPFALQHLRNLVPSARLPRAERRPSFLSFHDLVPA